MLGLARVDGYYRQDWSSDCTWLAKIAHDIDVLVSMLTSPRSNGTFRAMLTFEYVALLSLLSFISPCLHFYARQHHHLY